MKIVLNADEVSALVKLGVKDVGSKKGIDVSFANANGGIILDVEPELVTDYLGVYIALAPLLKEALAPIKKAFDIAMNLGTALEKKWLSNDNKEAAQ